MTDWTKPMKLSDVHVAFPAGALERMPAYKDIPEEFRRRSGPWSKWAATWFFKGLSSFPAAKEGIDQRDAMCHLSSIIGSFEPKHEHKEAAIAYLASLWLESPEVPHD